MPRARWLSGAGDDAGSPMTVERLELILRHFADFRSLYEATGQQEFPLPGGLTLNVHDLEMGIRELPKRQRQALVLTCVYNLREADAARLMGLKGRSSPVGSYKKLALQKLVEWHWSRYGEGDGLRGSG